MRGWVYIITNEAMPNLLKVGFSTKDPELRARELSGTGVPYPHIVVHDVLVNEPRTVEQKAHQLLEKYNANKEWFNCDIETAINAIQQAINNPILETVEKNKKSNTSTSNSDIDINHPQLKFWIEFDKFLCDKEPNLERKMIPRRPQNYYSVVSLCPSYYIDIIIHLKENKLGCQIFIPNSKKDFDFFYSKKHQIETQIKKNNGDVLEWQRLNEKKASRISLFHKFNFEKQSKIDAFEWLLEMTKEFKNIFKPNGV